MTDRMDIENNAVEDLLRSMSDQRITSAFETELTNHKQRSEQAAAIERIRRAQTRTLHTGLTMKKYVLTALMTALMVGQAYLFGVSDWLVLLFVLMTARFMYFSLIRLYAGNRRMLSVYSASNSTLHAFLSRDRTIIMHIVASISSLVLSSMLVFLIKGMVLQQGYWPFFVVIVCSSLILYSFINQPLTIPLVDSNINHEISAYGNELVRIFYAAVILNIILALAFSAHDTFEFKISDVNFNNFTDRAVEQSFEKTDANHYSRIVINAYLLMDYAKIALAKVFVDLLNLRDNFYGFYLVIAALNLVKMFGFSVAFVLLQKGFDGTATALAPVIRQTLNAAGAWQQYTQRGKR